MYSLQLLSKHKNQVSCTSSHTYITKCIACMYNTHMHVRVCVITCQHYFVDSVCLCSDGIVLSLCSDGIVLSLCSDGIAVASIRFCSERIVLDDILDNN